MSFIHAEQLLSDSSLVCRTLKKLALAKFAPFSVLTVHLATRSQMDQPLIRWYAHRTHGSMIFDADFRHNNSLRCLCLNLSSPCLSLLLAKKPPISPGP